MMDTIFVDVPHIISYFLYETMVYHTCIPTKKN